MKKILCTLLAVFAIASMVPFMAFALEEQSQDMTLETLAFAEGISPLNAKIYNVATDVDLMYAVDEINGSTPTPPPSAAIIRITRSFEIPGSRVFSIRHPNVELVAGPGHFRVKTSTSNGFIVQNGGRLTVTGGSEGGSLEIAGANIYDSAIVVQPGGWAEVTNGVSITNYPNSAVRVNDGGYFRLSGNARLYLNRSYHPTGGGGGVHVLVGGTFEMFGGIIERNTSARGGGVFVASREAVVNGEPVILGGTFNMYGGEIRNNYATADGGGLFVTAHNLDRITIAEAAVFTGNVAENGKRIDNALAELYRHQIKPGTVSVTDMGDFLIDGESFAGIEPHAFTNYDINTEGPRFWRVSHAIGAGQGSVVAKIAASDVLIPNGAFVPEDTEIIFVPEPALLLDRWEIGTRTVEADEDGKEIGFQFSGSTDVPLLHIVKTHVHAIAHFSEGVSLTKKPNGGLGEDFVRWLPKGEHSLTHVPAHGNAAMLFVGWNTKADGSGTPYAAGGSINITEDTVLYAQWRLQTTTLTISKEVTGDFANRSLEFEFTIVFMDANEAPLPPGTQFDYVGDPLNNFNGAPPPNGTLTLDSDGSAVFQLQHGQAIRIDGVPLGGYIRVVETWDGRYQASFKDSESGDTPINNHDTDVLLMTAERTLRFENERLVAPPTGLDLGHAGAMLLLSIFVSLLAFTLFVMGKVCRRRKKPSLR